MLLRLGGVGWDGGRGLADPPGRAWEVLGGTGFGGFRGGVFIAVYDSLRGPG